MNRFNQRDSDGQWPPLWTPSNRRRDSALSRILDQAHAEGLELNQKLREHDELRRRRLEHESSNDLTTARGGPGAGGHPNPGFPSIGAVIVLVVLILVLAAMHWLGGRHGG